MAEDAIQQDVTAAPETQSPEVAGAEPSAASSEFSADDLGSLWDDDESSEESKPSKSEESQEEKPKTDEPAEVEEAEEAGEGNEPNGDPKEKTSGKQTANARIQQLTHERNQYKAQVQEAIAQGFQPKTVEQLVDEGMSESDARLESLSQQVQSGNDIAKLTDLNLSIDASAAQVLEEFPILNPESPDYDENFATRAKAMYEEVAGLELLNDDTDLYKSVRIMPHQFYKTFVQNYQDGIEKGRANGKVEGQKATEEMLANVDPVTSATPPKQKTNSVDDIWRSDDD